MFLHWKEFVSAEQLRSWHETLLTLVKECHPHPVIVRQASKAIVALIDTQTSSFVEKSNWMPLLIVEKVKKTPIWSFVELCFHSSMEKLITEQNSSLSVKIRSLKYICKQVTGNKSLFRTLLVGLSILAARGKRNSRRRFSG